MSKRDEAIEAGANAVLESHFRRTGVTLGAEVWDHARAAITAYESVMHPLVEDVAGLDALPVGTILRSELTGGITWAPNVEECDLPARVIHHP